MATNASPWWSGERVVRLCDVPGLLFDGPEEDRPSVSTIYRWSTAGTAGVRLRRFRATPHAWATTAQEVGRFQAALTELAGEVVR